MSQAYANDQLIVGIKDQMKETGESFAFVHSSHIKTLRRLRDEGKVQYDGRKKHPRPPYNQKNWFKVELVP